MLITGASTEMVEQVRHTQLPSISNRCP